MIRVAVDANSLAWGWGGIPRYVQRLVERLAREPDLELTLLANREGPFARIPGTREVVCRRHGGSLWRNGFVAPWLAQHRPDVFWASETLVPLRVPVPSVVTVHDLAGLLLPGIKPPPQRIAYRTSSRLGARRARRVICVSRASAADAHRLWRVPESSLRVIPLGVDDVFAPGDRADAQETVRRRWGLGRPYVLAVGSIEPRKGLETLVGAAEEARRRGAEWDVVLAGGLGHDGERLARTAQGAGCRWLGRVGDEELVALYRAAEAVAVPSLYEGFGLTSLEAMACGTPAVIAAGSGGLEEYSGPAAVVVQDRAPAAWFRALDGAIAERAALIPAGLSHAATFTWDASARATADVLRDAAARVSGPAGP
jgi:glycosyltransferase involved in cell wall biosynthesis